MFIPKQTLLLAVSAALVVGPLAHGQTVSSTTTSTTSSGLVSELAPDGLVIRTETSTVPIRYSFSAATTYVDETGAPVSRELVTSGLPVTVQYSRDGERLIADRVVVRRQTTTTTAAPALVEKTTTITPPPTVVEKVVEKPVIVEKRVPVVVEKKVPVDRPVIVEKRVPAPAPLVEEKTTTTTTTTSSGKGK
jgi:hypothetical protein